jgi:hypothetical protein
VDGVAVDVMPTDEEILGFSNQWYPQALQCATVRIISEDMAIRIVTAPYFLATKIDAFYNRGNGDFIASHDLEDIITLLDGRPELVDEIRIAPDDVKGYLAQKFGEFLKSRHFLDALPGHLMPDSASQQRIQILIERMKSIASLY